MLNVNASLNALRKIGTSQSVTANNIANANTTGFKASRVVQGEDKVSITSNQSQGGISFRGNQLDLAINGKGFISVSTSQGEAFTRSGDLMVDKNGVLSDSSGNPVNPPIAVPPAAGSISINGSGEVTANVNGQQQNIGQLTLTTFPNPGGLTSIGSNLQQESIASGQGVANTPGLAGAGFFSAGGLESSNVEMADNFVTMIIDKHTFAYNINAIKVQNDMNEALLNIKG